MHRLLTLTEQQYLQLQQQREPHQHNTMHVDGYFRHMVLIYYVNDSDGDTLFYEERHPGSELVHGILDNSKVTLSKRVTPKFNRYVIFDGLQFHSSSAPKETDYRFVINYNFI